jgi:hypothetical protein
MNTRYVVATALAWATQSGAACVADDPVATARWIYANDRGFAFHQSGRDLSKRVTYLSPALYALLRADWECQKVEEGICALDADPWLNAQDGEELPPVNFLLTSTVSSKATVTMTFRFGWQDTNSPVPVPAEARLELSRDAQSGCWQLDDLIGRKGVSLKKQLKDYPHDA